LKKDRIVLCRHCIDAIRSRGEKVIVFESLYYSDEYSDNDNELFKCEFCDDELTTDELFECEF